MDKSGDFGVSMELAFGVVRPYRQPVTSILKSKMAFKIWMCQLVLKFL